MIRIGATPVPHADILNFIKPKLEKEGIELKVTEFTDFVQLNLALNNKDLDANYFQSTPYLETYEKQYGVKFATLVGVHLEPMAVYSRASARSRKAPALRFRATRQPKDARSRCSSPRASSSFARAPRSSRL